MFVQRTRVADNDFESGLLYNIGFCLITTDIILYAFRFHYAAHCNIIITQGFKAFLCDNMLSRVLVKY